MSIHVLQREVDEVGLRVDGDRVRARHLQLAELAEIAVALLEHCDGSRFRRHVEALEPRIEGKNVGIVAYRVNGEKLHRAQVEDGQRVVLFAGNKGEAIGLVERDAVRVLDAGQLVAAYDLHRCGVDGNQLVDTVHGNQNAA